MKTAIVVSAAAAAASAAGAVAVLPVLVEAIAQGEVHPVAAVVTAAALPMPRPGEAATAVAWTNVVTLPMRLYGGC